MQQKHNQSAAPNAWTVNARRGKAKSTLAAQLGTQGGHSKGSFKRVLNNRGFAKKLIGQLNARAKWSAAVGKGGDKRLVRTNRRVQIINPRRGFVRSSAVNRIQNAARGKRTTNNAAAATPAPHGSRSAKTRTPTPWPHRARARGAGADAGRGRRYPVPFAASALGGSKLMVPTQHPNPNPKPHPNQNRAAAPPATAVRGARPRARAHFNTPAFVGRTHPNRVGTPTDCEFRSPIQLAWEQGSRTAYPPPALEFGRPTTPPIAVATAAAADGGTGRGGGAQRPLPPGLGSVRGRLAAKFGGAAPPTPEWLRQHPGPQPPSARKVLPERSSSMADMINNMMKSETPPIVAAPQAAPKPLELSVGRFCYANEAMKLACAQLHTPIIPTEKVKINPQGTYTVNIMAGDTGIFTRTHGTREKAIGLASAAVLENLRRHDDALVTGVVTDLRAFYLEKNKEVNKVLESGPYTEVRSI